MQYQNRQIRVHSEDERDRYIAMGYEVARTKGGKGGKGMSNMNADDDKGKGGDNNVET
jgi:hypothetical protein